MIAVRINSFKVFRPLSLPVQSVNKRALVTVRAQQKTTDASEELYEKTQKVVAGLTDKWEKTEEKPALIGLVAASIVLLYVLNGLVTAIDKIPVVSGVFELVGIFVSSWFVYRYLVFGPDRQELKENINEFIKKVQGKTS